MLPTDQVNDDYCGLIFKNILGHQSKTTAVNRQ